MGKYDGSSDPQSYIADFLNVTANHTKEAGVLCQLFHESLTGLALNWYRQLEPGSIVDFDLLVHFFERKYCGRRKPKKDALFIGTVV